MIGTFANKFNLRVAACNKSGSKKNELREEKEEWIENLLERSGIAYATPGRRDTIYIGTDGGKWSISKSDTYFGNFETYYHQ